MSQFLSEIQEKYMKIVKSANLIGFLSQLVFPSILTNSQPPDNNQQFGENYLSFDPFMLHL